MKKRQSTLLVLSLSSHLLNQIVVRRGLDILGESDLLIFLKQSNGSDLRHWLATRVHPAQHRAGHGK
jgi:hypothetical protein